MIIGVTGGIASGKSEVCRLLEEAGFIHIDADAVAHEVLEERDIVEKAAELFGHDVLTAGRNGTDLPVINRKELGKIVFSDPQKMKMWEDITHPRVVQKIKDIVSDDTQNYVIEAIALIKSGLISACDELWVVHAEPEQQLQRLMKNRNMTYEDAIDRLNSQKEHDWDENEADRIIYSTEPLETVSLQVRQALQSML